MEEEHYKKIIYLKSGDNNIFSYPHAMNDSVTTGYITVGSGGSMPLTRDLRVSLEMDPDALAAYNYRNYGDETAKYARMLPPDRFLFPTLEVYIRAGEPSATVFVPVEVDANGLSPDTVYMLPVRIKSAGEVEINEDRSFVLYRIELVNKYTSASSGDYRMRGTSQTDDDGSAISNITATKKLYPLAHNRLRLFPENLTASASLADINSSAIVLVIDEDNSVRVKPYKYIEIESSDDCSYDPEKKSFVISYKYRLPGKVKWITVHETLTRLE
jgi:hypothetical protein